MTEKDKQPNPKLYTAPSDELVRKYGALGAIILHRICLRAHINKEGYSKAGYKDYILQFGIPKSTFYRTIKALQKAGALLTSAELKEKGFPTKYHCPKIKIKMSKPTQVSWVDKDGEYEVKCEEAYRKSSNVYPINQNKTFDEIRNDTVEDFNKPQKRKRNVLLV